jgi:hypothetical protein
VATKQMGKKHGKRIVNPGNGYMSVAHDSCRRQLVPDSRTGKTWAAAYKTISRTLQLTIRIVRAQLVRQSFLKKAIHLFRPAKGNLVTIDHPTTVSACDLEQWAARRARRAFRRSLALKYNGTVLDCG